MAGTQPHLKASAEHVLRQIPFHRPSFDEQEIKAVEEVLRSGWITTGQRSQEFEARFAEYVGARHGVAVNSCTAALHLALAGEDVGAGDEVITTPYTFIATVEAICYTGAKPVLVDIDPRTRNIDASAIEEKVTKRTKAIVPVHIAGLPCDMDPILDIAARHDLAVIEDAAHSLPASYRGRPIGSLGRATCFSFYATKNLTTAEGGMITTDDVRLAERYRQMSLHGINKDGWQRYRLGGSWHYKVVEMGYKYNLTDVAAALGLVQLKKLNDFDRRRRQLARHYTESFSRYPFLKLPEEPSDRHHAWHLYIIGLDPPTSPINRDEFIARLAQQGVGTSVHFIPVPHHPHYARALGYKRADFPHAEAAYESAVSLPLYPAMSDDDARYVVKAVGEALEGRISA